MVDGKFPVDASGALPDGRKFSGPQELEAVLRQDGDAFTRALTEKLLTYALGRGLERYDRRTVKAIARRVAESDYRFSALVMEIAQSLPFRMRKGDGGAS
jgi:CRISPR/Cas system-associated protein Cas10 (large subunit of type III CRISPR-Cas system)